MTLSYELDGSTAIIIEGSTEIPDYAFYNSGITDVVIPDSVTTIGDYAFYGNDLESVDIPDSVTEIGEEAFRYNNLASIDIPDSVVALGSYAFADNALESVVIPNGITSIPYGLFYENQITSVTIPDSVEIIYGNSFSGNQLSALEIPDNVELIGSYAFASNDLTSIEIPDNVITIENRAFWRNDLVTLDIGSSVAVIGSGAFLDNQIEVIEIPASVNELGEDAFGGNPQLSSISISEGSDLDLSIYEEAGISIIYREIIYNTISSVSGQGVLEGTADADLFTFAEYEVFGIAAADKIIGFDSSQGDSIVLAAAAFPSLTDTEEISFDSSSNARELIKLCSSDIDLIYYERLGLLLYNGNGSDKGLGDPSVGGLMAILDGGPELAGDDFSLSI